jgi:hypothetical protein
MKLIQWLKLDIPNDSRADLDHSICSFTDTVERHLDNFLNDIDEDLNYAKLSLNEESTIYAE